MLLLNKFNVSVLVWLLLLLVLGIRGGVGDPETLRSDVTASHVLIPARLVVIHIILVIARRASSRVVDVITVPVHNLGQSVVESCSLPAHVRSSRISKRVLLENGWVLVSLKRGSIGVVSKVLLAVALVRCSL